MGGIKRASSENLLAVLALHERGSYGAAAKAINRDSATVKYHLMAARQAYDDDVLVYADGSWQPTTEGRQILELAAKARVLNDALRGFDRTKPRKPTTPGPAEPGSASESAA